MKTLLHSTRNKFAFIMMACLVSKGIQGEYFVTLANTTDGDVFITVNPASESLLCPKKGILVPAKSQTGINVGLCCTDTVYAQGQSGSVNGSTAWFNPPATGATIACRSYTVIIKKTADNRIVLEQG